ncbi:hypothetical protein HXX76_001844 [Chlamydomonas incerta]|uniref:Uncharacterized protein n=1 Tax=Chlamydomonas incerta TaxID=51695 RepID=A0A835TG47_CHLIN|nr:hypothetical protein HXX76_001844 [Chlamydomonas incerta]|eukprot:KAG2443491.1 hypothetical protein HXX76_001844 [Chlamydomonas incerta]
MRPVAVQSILEQHCSAGALRIVGAAARLAAEEEQANKLDKQRQQEGAPEPQVSGGVLITSAHLALAALADGDSDCAAALGVLHHSAAGLSLQRCAELLAEQSCWAQRQDSGSSSSSSDSSSSSSIFSAGALHFLFHSYRWVVFSGCDAVQPCHLLWALAADLRDSSNPLRTDPLDEHTRATAVGQPLLMSLLQECRYEELPRPAATYEQLLGVVQNSAMAAAEKTRGAGAAAASRQAASSSAAGGSRGAGAAAASDRDNPGAVEACDALAIGDSLNARLDEVAAAPGSAARSLGELAALLRACRLAGHVPSRTQLQGLEACSVATAAGYWYAARQSGDPDRYWRSVYELAEGFAALGYQPGQASQHVAFVSHSVCVASPPPATAAAGGVCGRVHWWCRIEAAMQFCYPASAAVYSESPCQRVLDEVTAAGAATYPELLQVLLAVADLPSSVPWRPVVVGRLAAHIIQAAAQSTAVAAQLAVGPVSDERDLGRVLECLALHGGVNDGSVSAALQRTSSCRSANGVTNYMTLSQWKRSSSVVMWQASANTWEVHTAWQALQYAFPLPVRAQLLQALGGGGGSGGAGAPPSTFHVDLRELLAVSLEADNDDIHATLRVQQRVGEACAAAGCGVPEGWLQQLASYGDAVGGGCSSGGSGSSSSSKAAEVAAALSAVLKAAGAAARRAAADGGGGTAAASGAGFWINPYGSYDSYDSDDDMDGIRDSSAQAALLGQLASMVVRVTAGGHLTPHAALEAMRDLHAMATAVAAAAGGGADDDCVSASGAPAAAVLELPSAASPPAQGSGGLKALVEALEGLASTAALPPLLLGSRRRQLQALLDGNGGVVPPERG